VEVVGTKEALAGDCCACEKHGAEREKSTTSRLLGNRAVILLKLEIKTGFLTKRIDIKCAKRLFISVIIRIKRWMALGILVINTKIGEHQDEARFF
jgi:hypothetical protein